MARRDEKRQRPSAKRDRGGSPSERQNRAGSINAAGKKIPAFRNDEKKFNMVVDGVPYSVRSIPFLFNDEPRFRVMINGRSEHLFAWDSQAGIMRAIDDESSTLPSVLEEALSERLQSR